MPANAVKRVILVAHGEGEPSFSIPKVKTITRGGSALSFEKAIEYMSSTNAWPEYASTSFGTFGPLSDEDCEDLFQTVPEGDGIVSTGLRRGGDMAGPSIYTLRGRDLDKDALSRFIDSKGITSMVLLACREA